MSRVYVDACVLMLAFKAQEDDVSMRAIEELDRVGVDYLFSAITELELVPQPTVNRRPQELQFYAEFFSAAERVSCSDEVQQQALGIACAHGLAAADALHLGSAVAAEADEFLTAEGVSRPLGRLHERTIEKTCIRTVRF